MHGSNRLASQYHQLKPRERLELMLEAQARDDAAEVQRLWETCPVKAYRHADAAFEGPYDAVEKMSLSFGIDLAYQLGHLHMLHALRRVLPVMLVQAAAEAVRIDRAAEEAETNGSEDDQPGQADVPQTADASPEAPAEGEEGVSDEYDGMCAECLPRTYGHMRRLYDLMAGQRAGRAHGILRGMDAFAQGVLGVEAKLLLAAMLPPLLASIEDFGVETAAADEQQAKDFEQMALAAWRRLLSL